MKPRALVCCFLLLTLGFIMQSLIVKATEYKEVNATVKADDILNHIQTDDDINLVNCIIVGELNISKIKLKTIPNPYFYELLNKTVPYDERTKKILNSFGLNENLSVIGSNINVENSVFENKLDFSNVQFENIVSFKRTNFNDSANFEMANFKKSSDFDGTKFKNSAKFYEANFNNSAYFTGVTFNNFADFNHAFFENSADFKWANFNNSYFKGTNFNDFANFEMANFNNSADFDGAKFNNSADFTYAIFEDFANFHWATFNNSANFDGANFNNSADFDGAKFNNSASFYEANFIKSASFYEADFIKSANFNHSILKDSADFRWTHFYNSANFSDTIFNNQISFIRTEFHDRSNFTGPKKSDNIIADEDNLNMFRKYYDDRGRYGDGNTIYYNYRLNNMKQKQHTDPEYWIDFFCWLIYGYGVKPFYALRLGAVAIFLFSIIYANPICLKRTGHKKTITLSLNVHLDKTSNKIIPYRLSLTNPGIVRVDDPNQKVHLVDIFYYSTDCFTFVSHDNWYPRDNFKKWETIEGVLGWLTLGIFMTTLGTLIGK